MDKQKGFTISELIFVLLIVGIIALLLLPLIKSSKINMTRTICMNNMQKMGLALYIYAREHDGSFPPSVKTLYNEKYLSDLALLDCPATREKGGIDSTDYIYTSGLSVKSPSAEILVKDKTDNHDDGRNIMLVNGTIKWQEF